MWTRNSLAAALFAVLLTAPAAAQLGGGSAPGNQDHSSALRGGTTVAPKLLTMTDTSTATLAGKVNLTGTVSCSTCSMFLAAASTFTATGTVRLPLLTSFSSATIASGGGATNSRSFSVCVATAALYIPTGQTHRPVRVSLQLSIASGSSQITYAYILQNGIPIPSASVSPCSEGTIGFHSNGSANNCGPYILTNPGAGTQRYCFGIASSVNSVSVGYQTAVLTAELLP